MHVSKKVSETGWKQDESGMGEGVLTLGKLETNFITSIKQYLALAEIPH